MKRLAAGGRRIYLEDEGRLIGRICLPDALRARMAEAPLVVVEQTLPERVQAIVEDYIVDLGARYRRIHGEDGDRLHAEKLQHDLSRIRKRLGGERQQQLSGLMDEAFEAQRRGAGPGGHRAWIEVLLAQYYDPMYEYQLGQRRGRVLFRGERQAVIDWCLGAAQ